MANHFLDDICAALENNESTDEVMKDVPTAETVESLPTEDKAPGDPDATPVPDDDKSKVEELPAEAKASTEEAPAPGDPNANPAPANDTPEEANEMDNFILSALDPAVELFGKPSKEQRKSAAGMATDDQIKAALQYFSKKNGGKFDQSPEAAKKMDEAVTAFNAQMASSDAGQSGTGKGNHMVVKKVGGLTIGLFYANDQLIEIQVPVVGKARFEAFSAAKIASAAAKNIRDTEKAAGSTATEGISFLNMASAAGLACMESEESAVADVKDTFGNDTTATIEKDRDLHKNRNLIPLQQEKDAKDASGNTGDPADNKQTPVSPSGEPKEASLDKGVKDSYSADGHTDEPGVNGTPVSKSGDSKPLAKTEAEKAADDKDGNPEAPGVNGDPAPSFEAFITACEQLMTEAQPGTVNVPESMSLESYVYELGMGEIASRAVEGTLTAAEKRALKDSDFGLPEERKWPLHDETHVRSAIQHFHWCPKEKQRELAKNILKAMRKYKMKDVEVSEGNPFLTYYPSAHVVPRKKPERKKAQQPQQ